MLRPRPTASRPKVSAGLALRSVSKPPGPSLRTNTVASDCLGTRVSRQWLPMRDRCDLFGHLSGLPGAAPRAPSPSP
eukprot:2704034-Alexandrium_andersonii.AAC.1